MLKWRKEKTATDWDWAAAIQEGVKATLKDNTN
jgi:hypothetical protein